ncbi:hypothetical protein [Serratia fonticola]|uniref:hypothetical protein n=1 Tax=Serratia fonticola TaxID=47917 RepID=UPI003AB0C376
MIKYASDFQEIPDALHNNQPLRDSVLALIKSKKIAGKVTEGEDRLAKFKQILTDLVKGEITVDKAISLTEVTIPRLGSIHAGSNQVFATGWAERLVRTQFSRFYNQAVLESEVAKGNTECFVPPSKQEQPTSQCSQNLAGRSHDISHLLKLLVASYEDGKWDKTPKIPDHPHCTHVVKPIA